MEPEESIRIIQTMIETSRKKISDGSKHFLLWGWAVFLSALAQYILIRLHVSNSFLVWLSMLLAAVIAYLMGRKDKKQATVKTFSGDAVSKLWFSMTFGFLLLAYYQTNGRGNSIPLFILLYGIGILATGKILEFTPFVMGGMSCFILSFIGMNLDNDETQLLLLALAVLVSYIIPGHLLKAAYKKQSGQ